MGENKTVPARRKVGHVKADIVEYATELFATRGYDAVTTRDICTGANVAMSGLYRHFRDKQQLYMHCVLEAFGAVQEETFGLLDRDLSDRALLFQFAKALCAVHVGPANVTKIILRQMIDNDEVLLARVADVFIVGPAQRVKDRAEKLVGPARAAELVFRIFAMSFGFPHIQPMLKLLGWELPHYGDLDSMALSILSIACPEIDWRERTP